MASDRRCVYWSLARKCAIRPDGLNESIRQTEQNIERARSLVHSRQDREEPIVDGICVERPIWVQVPEHLKSVRSNLITNRVSNRVVKDDIEYPDVGFVVPDSLRDVTGRESVKKICSQCPANTREPESCGCFGRLWIDVKSESLHQRLEAIVDELGIRSEVERLFPKTTPMIYGFWMRSPLSKDAARVLRAIMTALWNAHTDSLMVNLCRSYEGPWYEEAHEHYGSIRSALDAALRHDMILSVELGKPLITLFNTAYSASAHCPVCRAQPRRDELMLDPSIILRCHVCGKIYRPSEMDLNVFNPEPELRELLGEERFTKFAKDYFVTKGWRDTDAAALVEFVEKDQKEKQIRLAREEADEKRMWELFHAWKPKVLYAGLNPVQGFYNTSNHTDRCGLRPQEFEVFLARCREHGLTIGAMYHQSSNPKLNRQADMPPLGDEDNPEKVFAQWQAEGCHEVFSYYPGPSKELSERLLKENPAE